MSDRPFNVLFLCTGNSARSIMAESILRGLGGDRFNAFSAGSHPGGIVNPLAIKTLQSFQFPTEGLRSKSWNEFAVPSAPIMDFVLTVCDQAAGEACPVWPGQPMSAHWGIEAPSAVQGHEIEKEKAFVQAAKFLRNRISIFISLPIASLNEIALRRKVEEIGAMEGASPKAAAAHLKAVN
jgi:arsenate reductase